MKNYFLANSRLVTVLFLLGILLRIAYLGATPYNTRSYDFDGHLDYIKYIAENKSLPAPNTGWEFWQPPLYYLVAGFVYTLASAAATKLILLQILSLIFNIGFLYFGVKTLRLYLPKEMGDKYFNLASALLIFWPAGIMYAVTITNDSLLYFLMAAGMYFITKWFLSAKTKDLLFAALFLLASMLTKSSGIALLGVICFAVLLRFILTLKANPKKFISFLKTFSFILFISLACFAIMFFARLSPAGTDRKHGFFTNMPYVNSGLLVGNSINNFLVFDAKDFFTNVYTSSWNDKGGRQYFLNYFLKTSLFGEFSFSQHALNSMAILLNYLLILIFIIICVRVITDLIKLEQYFKAGDISSVQILATPIIILFLAVLIVYRYLYPYSCNGDFRYIYPIIIPISAIAGYVVYVLEKRWWLASFVEIITCVFVITSIFFFIGVVVL